MPKAKRKNCDKPDLENHPYLSKKLVDIIYNPELPIDYRFLSEGRKLYVLHMLYLSLNPNFQKEFGKQLEEWISRAEADIRGIDVNDIDFIKCRSISDVDFSEIETEYHTITYSNGKTFFIPIELCMILLRSEIGYIAVQNDAIMADMIDANGKWDNSLYAEVFKLFPYDFGSVFESRRIDKFQEFVEAREENRVPNRIYAAIDIIKPKEKIIEAFGKFIDSMQELYFKQDTTLRHPLYGHKEYTSDGKRKSYRFDDLERYFKAYIYCARGMKQRDIAKIFFPNDAIGSGETKVSQDIRKAKNLIKNAWTGDFPGKYISKT